MRASWAETREGHPDPALRPRVYEGSFGQVFALCVRAAEELDTVELAEADPRRAVVAGWVKLAPFAALPLLGPPKHPGSVGLGWFRRLDPRLAKGWLQVRLDPLEKGGVRVTGHVRLELPLAGRLAAALLKNYLRWLDLRWGMPVKP